ATYSSSSLAAGPHSLTASYAGNGNYLASTSATLSHTVNATALIITANSTNKTYGQTLTFTGTEFGAGGLQNGETVGAVALGCSGAAASAVVSGSPYDIIPSALTGGTFNPTNYSITYLNGSLTVAKATLMVTADGFARVYGATNPLFTVEYSGFVNGEN